MPNLDELKAAFLALVRGGASEQQGLLVRDAVESGQIALATGERAVAVGGDANGATIVTGDNNVLLSFGNAEAVRAAFAQLFPSRRHQLPRDLDDFIGREREVAELCEALAGDGGQAAISAIGGMGGIGKTALAVHIGHRLAPHYPDGQLVIELRGTSDDPLPPAQSMTELIRSLTPAARVPDDPRDIERLYRSTLHGQRVLILLDNAADGAQVRPLLPSPPGAAIVTSRRAIVLPGLRRIDLDVMGEGESRDLLRGILAKRRPGDAELDAITDACGHLALALRVAGTFLARNRDWTVPEYVAALADERERLMHLKIEDDPQLNVAAALGVSAAQLVRDRPELAARWETLTVFPTGFDRAAAAAVWDVPADEARDGLSALVERSMVLFDPDRARYRLHDLMRDVARGLVRPGEDQAAQTQRERRLAEAVARHTAYYQTVLASAEALYLQGGEAIAAGLALYDLEQRNIGAGHAWALAHALQGGAAVRLAASYPNQAADILNLRLHPPERIRWLEAAVDACRCLGDRQGEGKALGSLGVAYDDLGERRRAIGLYEQHLAIARETGDRQGEGNALGNLGVAYAALGEPRRAIELFEQRLAIAREIGDRRGEGNMLNNLGLVYTALGEPQRAIELYEQALVILREIGDRRGEGNALGSLGDAYRQLGERRRAIELFEQRLAIAREIGDRRGEGSALGNLGLVYAALGERRRAIELYEQDLAIAREIGDRHSEGKALNNLGLAYYTLGDRRRAIKLHGQRLAIAREIGDRRGEGNALFNSGLALYALGDRGEAIERVRAALQIYEVIESPNAAQARAQLAEWGAEEPG